MYPVDAIHRGQQADVVLLATIDADGSLRKCSLAKATAARDAKGQPMVSCYSANLYYRVGE